MSSRSLRVATPDGLLVGEIHGAELDLGHPVAIALHGLAGNRATWQVVGRLLGDDITLLALDLRGRGDSRDVGPPYGIRQHVADVLAAAESIGARRFVVSGTSMGGYVAAALARLHADRVHGLVLVDALMPRPMPTGVDLDASLADDPIVGGAIARIETTSTASIEAYRELWRRHPALDGTGVSDEVIVVYSDREMDPSGPPFRPGTRPEALIADARELRLDTVIADAADHVECPVWVLHATRGLRNGPRPFLAADALVAYAARHPNRPVRLVEVPDTNHFSITLGERGAAAVAAAIRHAAGALR